MMFIFGRRRCKLILSKRLSKAKRLSLDIITTLPETIIQTILCLLPIEEAARTSTLSREWRYKWTKIPKVEFSGVYGRLNMLHAIHQVLLRHQEPIHEFILDTTDVDFSSCEQLDQILQSLLSGNHPVKKLYIDLNKGEAWYNLPLFVFSLHQLTDLFLGSCCLDHQPIFNGFANLTSLTLDRVMISIKTLLNLLSSCPSLKSYSLILFDIDIMDDTESTMIELFECLPVIEHLTIYDDVFRLFVPDLAPQELPTSLIHLKCFRFFRMTFLDSYILVFLAVLIKSSPNLEKIELEIAYFEEVEFEECHWWEHLSDVWLYHLTELKFEYFGNLEPELEFVKFILARSPKLRKVSIAFCRHLSKEQKSGMLKTLMRARRVSSEAEIVVV